MFTITPAARKSFSFDRSGHGFLPIQKVDRQNRMVWGVAQVQEATPDTQGDIVDFEASVKAFKGWAGNVRVMHESEPAGRAIKIVADPKSKQILVGVHVSKGNENAWQMVLDGTLAGFSIGGRVLKDHHSTDPKTGKRVHHITEYELDELSLVDTPANGKCKITAIVKRKKGEGLVMANDLNTAGPRPASSLLTTLLDIVKEH